LGFDFGFVSFGFVSIGFFSFRSASFRFDWFRFALIGFVSISFRTLQVPSDLHLKERGRNMVVDLFQSTICRLFVLLRQKDHKTTRRQNDIYRIFAWKDDKSTRRQNEMSTKDKVKAKRRQTQPAS
jgi:hypothetical protein